MVWIGRHLQDPLVPTSLPWADTYLNNCIKADHIFLFQLLRVAIKSINSTDESRCLSKKIQKRQGLLKTANMSLRTSQLTHLVQCNENSSFSLRNCIDKRPVPDYSTSHSILS